MKRFFPTPTTSKYLWVSEFANESLTEASTDRTGRLSSHVDIIEAATTKVYGTVSKKIAAIEDFLVNSCDDFDRDLRDFQKQYKRLVGCLQKMNEGSNSGSGKKEGASKKWECVELIF